MTRAAIELPRVVRWALGAAIALYLIKVVRVVAGGPLVEYPIMFPDSFDWLSNGLYYAGVRLETTWRSVLNPLVFGALFTLHLDDLIPFIGPCYLAAAAWSLMTVGRRAMGDAAVFAAVLLVANHAVLPNALVIGSDVTAIGLSITAFLCWAIGVEEDRPAWLLLAAVAAAASFLAQPSVQLMLPALAAMTAYVPGGGVRGLWAGAWTALRAPRHWAALAVGGLVVLATFALRWWVCGAFNPRSSVLHVELMTLSLANVGYYAWSCVAWWSIPVTLLAVVGAVVGWRDRSRRRVTLGLLVAIAAHACFFVVVYGWRDNRFILYWTIPVLLLAGSALARLRGAVRWVVFALAIYWSNLAYIPDPSPTNVAMVWSPRRAAVMDYVTSGIRPSVGPIVPYVQVLREFVRTRRRQFADPNGDDLFYGRERELIGRLAGWRTAPWERIYFHIGPDEPSIGLYLLRNEFILFARRGVALVQLERIPAAMRIPPRAPVVLRRAEYDRLSAAGMRFTPLEIRERYCLVRRQPPS